MAVIKLFLVSVLLVVGIQEIYGQKMMDPINRSSVWRLKKYDDVPINYEDNENFCGGFHIQQSNGNRCGPCGDDYLMTRPRPNENGGKFGKGHVVQQYQSGQKIKVKIHLNRNFKGYFEFSICELADPRSVETEECFDQHKLPVVQNDRTSDKFDVSDGRLGSIDVDVILPQGLRCERCVLRWHYRSGNRIGMCKNGSERLGCGPQETFRSCSDIAIV